MEKGAVHEQLALVRARVSAPPKPVQPAEDRPVARIAVDLEPPHLDRYFDYAVPAKLAETAQPGVRVRVRFAGRLVDGFLIERCESSDFTGSLVPIERVLSPEPVLSPDLLALARQVADAYSGTLADVLRLVIPPRHAATEAEKPSPRPLGPIQAPDPAPWSAYPGGAGFLGALASGEAPRAVWTVLPNSDAYGALAAAVQATLAGGRGAVVIAATGRDVARIDLALTKALGEGRHVALTADLGAAERYRRWLALSRGQVRAVVGTAAAQFAPIDSLGLVAIWDDADSGHATRLAPYPHAREVLLMRAHQAKAGALIAGYTATAEAAHLVQRHWARPLAAPRAVVRDHTPRVFALNEERGRDRELNPGAVAGHLPPQAIRLAREALAHGPVLVQVPRSGYRPRLACAQCRETARCAHCNGPLAQPGPRQDPKCGWCGRAATPWSCRNCNGVALRSRATGVHRSAEELGRAFPGTLVRESNAARGVIDVVPGEPALVLATPGAEPLADGGYAAALLLDAPEILNLPTLRAAEQAVRRWLGAAALVRPASRGGAVLLCADGTLPAAQAVLRWDPAAFARRELADRTELGYPPSARIAELTGPYPALREILDLADLPDGAQLLGPVPVQRAGEQTERILVRCDRADGARLAKALKSALGVRTAKHGADPVWIRIDPVDLA
ncbi:primosomal protein N' [Actinospica sp. MGRD01-02]|uniref:Probable replication restart protein PriA n=1 Tax=Actinospica acidithermotolerans TaxID=2828514 RepID=A0A941E7C9_9ACTN|nr:primosomal protein N' [Actinospica acidithermotolerans]MBR7826396.1 primosomal protein N' [Actinospica acidithermotolerans]